MHAVIETAPIVGAGSVSPVQNFLFGHSRAEVIYQCCEGFRSGLFC